MRGQRPFDSRGHRLGPPPVLRKSLVFSRRCVVVAKLLQPLIAGPFSISLPISPNATWQELRGQAEVAGLATFSC